MPRTPLSPSSSSWDDRASALEGCAHCSDLVWHWVLALVGAERKHHSWLPLPLPHLPWVGEVQESLIGRGWDWESEEDDSPEPGWVGRRESWERREELVSNKKRGLLENGRLQWLPHTVGDHFYQDSMFQNVGSFPCGGFPLTNATLGSGVGYCVPLGFSVLWFWKT